LGRSKIKIQYPLSLLNGVGSELDDGLPVVVGVGDVGSVGGVGMIYGASNFRTISEIQQNNIVKQ
jgi:hypothetical protein